MPRVMTDYPNSRIGGSCFRGIVFRVAQGLGFRAYGFAFAAAAVPLACGLRGFGFRVERIGF